MVHNFISVRSARYRPREALEPAKTVRQDKGADQRGHGNLTDIDEDEPRLVKYLAAKQRNENANQQNGSCKNQNSPAAGQRAPRYVTKAEAQSPSDNFTHARSPYGSILSLVERNATRTGVPSAILPRQQAAAG